jgi:hypothetical protein
MSTINGDNIEQTAIIEYRTVSRVKLFLTILWIADSASE